MRQQSPAVFKPVRQQVRWPAHRLIWRVEIVGKVVRLQRSHQQGVRLALPR